jgi:hypothetical protein
MATIIGAHPLITVPSQTVNKSHDGPAVASLCRSAPLLCCASTSQFKAATNRYADQFFKTRPAPAASGSCQLWTTAATFTRVRACTARRGRPW